MSVMLVGEAWGREEEERREPFVGASGRLLNAFLRAVGISRSDCYLTNVFNLRPRPSNNILNLCGAKAEGIPGFPSLIKGRYVKAEYGGELTRLYKEVEKIKPNLIVALGATPAWALLRKSGIKKVRGAPAMSHLGVKVLPTYHPAAVMREYKLRPILFADLKKAVAEAEFKECVYPRREVWIEPTIPDLYEFEERYIKPSPVLSIDCETYGRDITCISFAPRIDIALVVPFADVTKQPDQSYWRTHTEEKEAWYWVRHICQSDKRIIGQNFLYDLGFLFRSCKIRPYGFSDDTMLLHHALHPELEKSLDFLASVYTTEQKWKWMRKGATLKRED